MPALLVLHVRTSVRQSPAWKAIQTRTDQRTGLLTSIQQNPRLSIYAIVLMTEVNVFSHGTQDLYPTFPSRQHGFDTETVSLIAEHHHNNYGMTMTIVTDTVSIAIAQMAPFFFS